jgi:hypothetical protein
MLESGGIKDIYTFNDEKAYPDCAFMKWEQQGWEMILKHLC